MLKKRKNLRNTEFEEHCSDAFDKKEANPECTKC